MIEWLIGGIIVGVVFVFAVFCLWYYITHIYDADDEDEEEESTETVFSSEGEDYYEDENGELELDLKGPTVYVIEKDSFEPECWWSVRGYSTEDYDGDESGIDDVVQNLNDDFFPGMDGQYQYFMLYGVVNLQAVVMVTDYINTKEWEVFRTRLDMHLETVEFSDSEKDSILPRIESSNRILVLKTLLDFYKFDADKAKKEMGEKRLKLVAEHEKSKSKSKTKLKKKDRGE